MPPAPPSVVQSSPPDSVASAASSAVSGAANGPAQVAIPSEKTAVGTVGATRKRSIDTDGKEPSQATREANDADDETESEAEMEFEAVDEPKDARETPPTRVGATADDQKPGEDDESEEEEEEDEEFPPAPPLPSPSSSTASVASVAKAPGPVERGNPSQVRAPSGTTHQHRQAAIVHLEEAVDAQADEKLLRVLLSHKSRLTDASRPQNAVWDAVGAELGSRQVATDAVKARARLRWLQQVVRNPAHTAHSRLTGPMRAMLAEVNAVMSPAPPRGMPVVEKAQSFSTTGIARTGAAFVSASRVAGDLLPHIVAVLGRGELWRVLEHDRHDLLLQRDVEHALDVLLGQHRQWRRLRLRSLSLLPLSTRRDHRDRRWLHHRRR